MILPPASMVWWEGIGPMHFGHVKRAAGTKARSAGTYPMGKYGAAQDSHAETHQEKEQHNVVEPYSARDLLVTSGVWA